MRHIITLTFVHLILLSCNEREEKEENRLAFTALDSLRTGISFSNKIVETENFNILTYRNFYNGGGVAIGDINNDALPDIYFTANQQKNKLYLNKGNFVFEDITTQAGVGGNMKWSTGVTMADVNGDGWLDIYVCNSGDVEGKSRQNELFINDGNLTFTEKGANYNLNNSGYSTHAAFFDYDTDGDLDCYILNNSFKDPSKIELYKKMREVPNEGGDKLMRNDGDIFTDVTQAAGIYSSDIGFGLGIAISDLNHDNLPDLYISNDFWERDYLYINNGKGQFKEDLISRISYCSTSSMGADIADLNNDGSPEIITTDMLPADNQRLKTTITFDTYHLEDYKYRANFHYQLVQNCLHINNGKGEFSERAHMAGIASTDWSWGALIFDFENDGLNDVFISNGILRDIMSMDFREFLGDNQRRQELIKEKGRFDLRDFIGTIPSKPLTNYAFSNAGNLKFNSVSSSMGLHQETFSNGAAYGDLDNDGDLDLAINNLNSPALIYKNNSSVLSQNNYLKFKFNGSTTNKLGIGASVLLKADGRKYYLENYTARGFQSSIEPILNFGLGKLTTIDSAIVRWPDGKKQILKNIPTNQTIIANYSQSGHFSSTPQKDQTIFYDQTKQYLPKSASHTENPYNDFNYEILLPYALSTQGPRIISGDINQDKLIDFVLLGSATYPDQVFIQTTNGRFIKKSSTIELDKMFESTCGALFDADQDKDLDLLIGSGGNEVNHNVDMYTPRFYRNDGRGNFTKDNTPLPSIMGNFSTVQVADLNSDGKPEIFLGARCIPGNYGLPPRNFLLKQDEKGWFDASSSEIAGLGLVTDAVFADVDRDGDSDLVVVGDWMPITILYNNYGNLESKKVIPNTEGWWTRLVANDIDNDGYIDFVLGNWGLNSKFKASLEKPLTMQVGDFDGNGKSEFIINWTAPLDTTPFPFALKNELTAQIPSLRKSILRYSDYEKKTFDSLFRKEQRNLAIQYTAKNLATSILYNKGKSFDLVALPDEAQVSPTYSIVVYDFDGDTIKDLWLGGNFYMVKPQVGRLDASRGLLLKGLSGGKFDKGTISSTVESIPGEIRDAQLIIVNNKPTLLIARNNDSMILLQGKK